jgi:hypothetical protein
MINSKPKPRNLTKSPVFIFPAGFAVLSIAGSVEHACFAGGLSYPDSILPIQFIIELTFFYLCHHKNNKKY